MKENSNFSFNFQIKFSNFLFGANTHPPKRKTTALWPNVACVKTGHVFHLWSLFWICAFCPYQEVVRGKPKKGKWLGKIKNKWRQISPHSPLDSNLLHQPPHFSPTYPDPPPWSSRWCGGEGWPQCAHFLTLKKAITCRHISKKKNFSKDGPPSSMVLLVFLERENLLKSDYFLIGKSA